jgi:hypothetical protein
VRRLVIPILLTLCAGVACWSSTNDATLRDMELIRLGGSVEVVRGPEVIEVDDKLGIRPGDVIATSGQESGARLRLQSDRDIELGADSELAVTSTSAVTGRSGTILADAREPTTVRFGDVEAASSEGLFRVDVGYGSARAGVYRGSATLSAPEQADTDVPALFQSSVAGTYVSSPGPLKLSPRDGWDLVHLGEVLDLDEQLDRLGRGLQTQLGGERPHLPYLAALADQANLRFMRSYLDRPVPDLLIAMSVARTTDGSFRRTFVRAFRLFDDGGQWGVVSAILGADETSLIAGLQDIILSTRVALASGERLRFTVASAENAARGKDGGAGTANSDSDGGQPTTGSVDDTTSGGSSTTTGSNTGTGQTGGTTGTGGTGGSTGGDGGGTGGGDGGGTGGGDGGGTGGGDGGGGDGECDPLEDPTCIVPTLPVPTPTGILP